MSIKNPMTVRTPRGDAPPKAAVAVMNRLDLPGEGPKVKWKTLVGTFTTPPSKADKDAKEAKIIRNCEPSRRKKQAEFRAEGRTSVTVLTLVQWFKFDSSEVKFFILVVMLAQGPPNQSINPPKTPAAPQSPL